MQPLIIGALALTIGTGLAIGGVFMLAGAGWAMVAGSVPCLILGAVVCRGLLIAERFEGADEAA